MSQLNINSWGPLPVNIQESIREILKTEDLVSGKFYERFLRECPHLQKFFENVDMTRQASMLTSAIVLVETVHSKEATGLSPYLRLLGRQHEQRGIASGDFADWADSMIRTLAEYHGDDWSDSLEKQWRDAIESSVSIMLEGYLRRESR